MSGGIVWTGIITGVITATATLTGVWLTQRHAWKTRRLDRQDARRLEQRDALVEVLLTGREWSRAISVLINHAHFARPSGERPPQARVDRYRELAAAHERSLWTARIVVSDSTVSSLLPQLAEHNEAVVLAMLDVLGRVEFSEGEDANDWDHHAVRMLRMVDEGLVQLEKLTRQAMVYE